MVLGRFSMLTMLRALFTFRNIVRDLNIPLEVVISPTLREVDGLAKSSRNSYLSESERNVAPQLFKALKAAEELYKKNPKATSKEMKEISEKVLLAVPQFKLDYFSLASLDTAREVASVPKAGALYSTAALLGKTRLIDNIIIEGEGDNR